MSWGDFGGGGGGGVGMKVGGLAFGACLFGVLSLIRKLFPHTRLVFLSGTALVKVPTSTISIRPFPHHHHHHHHRNQLPYPLLVS